MKQFLFLILFLTLLFGRENPFFPPKGLKTPSYTTNSVPKGHSFSPHVFSLPSSARVLKSVTLTYENLDGSITSKEFSIEEMIDWHKPLVLSYKTQKLQTQQAVKPVKQHKKTKQKFSKIVSLHFIAFYVKEHTLKIETSDKLLRNFKLVKPTRIVLDFKHDANFRTYNFKGRGCFKKIVIGNHDHYYRIVIELDGLYGYKIEKMKNGYLLKLY